MIRGPILAAIIVTILVLFPSMFDAEIAEIKPLDCLVDATDLELYQWGHYHDPVAIQDWQWDEMLALDGDSAWVGYEDGGWNVPDDIHGVWKITGAQYGEPIEIWIWRGDGEYYIFPFANVMQFADESGDHYGIHPCGGYLISDKLELLNTIARIMDNAELNYFAGSGI